MKKLIYRIESYLVVCAIVLLMTGCGSKYVAFNELAPGRLSEKDTSVWEKEKIISLKEKKEEEITTDEAMDNRPVDLTNYSSYMKKMWICEEWGFEEGCSVSLVIAKMEGGLIEGYYLTNGLVNYDFYLPQRGDKLPEFYGTIYEGTAECEYDYKDGRDGTLTVTFCENDRIEVTLDGNEAQRHLLRPYNIADVNFRDEPTSFEVELDSWGTVTLLYANLDSRHSVPLVYLLNEQKDILNEFSASYQHGSEVMEIIIEDMNEDGLKDVEVITNLGVYRLEWYFYQLENSYFYMGLCNGFEIE